MRNRLRFSARLERLFRRFELTIPLKRQVIVDFYHLTTGAEQTLKGQPAFALEQMLYLRISGDLVAIPKASVRSIRSVKAGEDVHGRS